jgi:hypothetical protein
VKVIGYSDEIEKVMHSANVMISKLGGLTTFEALACRLPIIADATTPPMPQEAGTVKSDLETRRRGNTRASVRYRSDDQIAERGHASLSCDEGRDRVARRSEFH